MVEGKKSIQNAHRVSRHFVYNENAMIKIATFMYLLYG